MIKSKYGLKYTMPHKVIHIVDNSSYTGETAVTVADDPSLFSTLVVTGGPMGEDNKIIALNRSDVANIAYGLGNLSTTDVKKYGQTIEYPTSLISQGAPVKLMRVTPEGSTYGLNCILVQWRTDYTDNTVHVRFKEVTDLEDSSGLQLSQFKNPTRLHEALVKAYYKDNQVEDGYTWTQRVFISNISAGRGKIYNNYITAINPVQQGKKPPNVKYEFVTINSTTSGTVEQFTASLVNIDNSSRADAITPVNIAVASRTEGSSIVKPFVNESAVSELYKVYMAFYADMIAANVDVDDYANQVYVSINVNTFDMINGNYLYNGSDTDSKLPYYQVDSLDTDIPSLALSNRVNTTTDFDSANPVVLYNKIKPYIYGLTRTGDSVYVGDLYLSSNTANPTISIVAVINQYNGAITSVSLPKLFAKGATTTTSTKIKYVFNDATSATTGAGSAVLNSYAKKSKLAKDDIVAYITSNTFTLFTVTAVTPSAESGDKYTLGTAWTTADVYKAIDWSASATVGNVIGIETTDTAYYRVGATCVDTTTGSVYVNDYNTTSDSVVKIEVSSDNKCKFGTVPTSVNITSDLVGSYFDVIMYDEADVTEWKVSSAAIKTAGTGYAKGDLITLVEADAKTKFVVNTVSSTGSVVSISVATNSQNETSTTSVIGDSLTTYTTGSGTGLKLTITENDVLPAKTSGNPSDIIRYLVSGVQGSLYRVQKTQTEVPSNYYTDVYGISMTSELGGVSLAYGSTGFFDDETLSTVEFKWKYSALLVKAYRGEIDPRILSSKSAPAKYLYDGGTNTIVGQTILSYLTYTPTDIINASTIFTDDEKDNVLFYPDSTISNILEFEDIDVKQAMYDLMITRVYDGMPEDKRPIGPGSGLSLHIDSGVTDANTALLINSSFTKRFDNPNASWDIGGYVASNGISYTFVKKIVDTLTQHSKTYSVNKPLVGKYCQITKSEYIDHFPDIDATDWDTRQTLYSAGGNIWIPDSNGNLRRQSQRTLLRDSDTSDIIQESNMRTLSQLTHIAGNKIEDYLLEYNDDGVLKTLSDEMNNLFANWVGNLVDSLDFTFTRDTNIDGGDILICNVNVVFRGLILRVPIIVNINRRSS